MRGNFQLVPPTRMPSTLIFPILMSLSSTRRTLMALKNPNSTHHSGPAATNCATWMPASKDLTFLVLLMIKYVTDQSEGPPHATSAHGVGTSRRKREMPIRPKPVHS